MKDDNLRVSRREFPGRLGVMAIAAALLGALFIANTAARDPAPPNVGER